MNHAPDRFLYNPPPMARTAPTIFALLALSLLALAGCETVDGVFSGVKPGSEGLLQDLFKEPSPSDAVEMSVDQYDADKRYRGTNLLANAPFAGEPVYLDLFIANASDEDPAVRSAAVRGLANHGSVEHAPLLAERLRDPDKLVRIEAARALQHIHSPAVVDTLLLAIKEGDLDADAEPDPQVRAQAADALGQYAENRVVRALIATLSDSNFLVISRARQSLRVLTGQDFGFDHKAWIAWEHDTKDLFAAQSVYRFPGYIRERKFVEHLPFVPQPPIQQGSVPIGMPPPGTQ